MTTNDIKRKVRLITLIGSLLQKYGTNAPRLEASLKDISKTLGLEGNFFSTPTYLALSIESDDEQINRHIRIPPGDTNLSMLQEVDTVAMDVCNGGLEIEEAIAKLKLLENPQSLYSCTAIILAYGLTSSALSVLLGGGINEVTISLLMGIILGLLSLLRSKNDKMSDIFEFTASFLIMFTSYFIHSFYPYFNYQNVLISGLIVIIPGLAITIAMSELATKNLVSGTARLMGALIEFFKISFGVLLGIELGKMVFPPITTYATISLPSYFEIPAICIASFCFTIIFQAKRKDFPIILMSGLITFFSLKFSSYFLNQILSLFVASFMIGLLSNLFARIKNRPSAIILVPGIIFLVPGSVGLKGLNLILQNNFIQGLSDGFQMFTLTITIVGGLFLANIMLNPRKHL
jgi:uncharacterized membrane protein YjjP (DUF1212 family)